MERREAADLVAVEETWGKEGWRISLFRLSSELEMEVCYFSG